MTKSEVAMEADDHEDWRVVGPETPWPTYLHHVPKCHVTVFVWENAKSDTVRFTTFGTEESSKPQFTLNLVHRCCRAKHAV